MQVRSAQNQLSSLDKNIDNLCITFGTLAAFCLGQGVFWIYVGSKQFENVIKDKVKIFELFFDHPSNQSLKFSFCKNIESSVTNESTKRVKEIQEENVKMLKERFWMFFSTTFTLFCISCIFVFLKYRRLIENSNIKEASELRAQRRGFLIGLFLVLFSFSTEIFIFKYIIQPYIIIGDLEILDKVI